MQLRSCTWTVLLVVILHITSTTPVPFRSDDYFYLDPDMDDDVEYIQNVDLADADYRPNESESDYVMHPRSAETTTECETEPPKHSETHTSTPHGPVPTTCIAIIPGATPKSPILEPATQPPQPAQPMQPMQPPQPAPPPQPLPPSPAPSTPAPLLPSTKTPQTISASSTETETTTCIPEDESTPKPTTLPYPYLRPVEATTCIPMKIGVGGVNVSTFEGLLMPPSSLFPAASLTEQEGKTRALHSLVQHLYVAQARVQLEAIEIKKAQAVANSAQQQLEEAANHVRSVTAALQNAQQEVASAAIRAQTAQLQLAAHDQLLFAARQDVDALSSQMVGLQAAEGIAVPTVKFDIGSLLDKLKQPLSAAERPTAVPPVMAMQEAAPAEPSPLYVDYDYD
ncbi:PREDICTED: translation initiation factor IF-2 [Rhagoletis zephyria]|uniref:translation initiation factor IF-2 n=1 Tax=Rhagoletis zephyria TaxID=28612 RepID=UPI000811479E|nr:PREDICTED: translation initiation factor IF-2 [Rhagoletis zephyria]